MAIYKKGADPVALRASAERITGHARECESLKGDASRAVHALKGQWGGADLDHLMNRWPPVEAQLTQFGTDLGKLAEALRRNAGAQDATSGQGGSGPAGGPGGPGDPGDNGGIPGYDLLKSLWTPVKGLGTAVGLLGTSMKIRNFLSNLSGWDKDLGLFKNLSQAWKTGHLAEFGDALNPKNWGTLSRFMPSLAEGGGSRARWAPSQGARSARRGVRRFHGRQRHLRRPLRSGRLRLRHDRPRRRGPDDPAAGRRRVRHRGRWHGGGPARPRQLGARSPTSPLTRLTRWATSPPTPVTPSATSLTRCGPSDRGRGPREAKPRGARHR